jgi:glycosyltransferase involved in cell wall biosynthesis
MHTDPSTMKAALVVAALNEEPYIGRYLRSAFAQSVGPDRLEVILVDGDSDDRTCEVAMETAAAAGWGVRRETAGFVPRTLTILRNPTRTTPSAFNIGAAAAACEVVIITGAHSELAPDFVEASIRVLVEEQADIVGGHTEIVTEDPRMAPLAMAQTSKLATGGGLYRTPGVARTETDTVPYPAFRRATWVDVGGFDEELLRNQDDEFILRVRQRGGKVVLSPEISFTYFARPTLPRLRRQYFQYGIYRPLTILKRGRPGSWRPLAPFALVPVVAVASLALFRRRPVLGALPLGLYCGAVLAEGVRLNRRVSKDALRTALAIATMQWAYGIGEWVGIARLLRRRGTAR